MMPLYITAPGDEHGNTAHPPAIIEAEPRPHDLMPERTVLHVTAPAGFAWPTVSAGQYVRVPDDAGPPRMLTVEEWLTLIGWAQS